MAEPKSPEGAKKTPQLTPQTLVAATQVPEEKITPPKEYQSMNGKIKVIIDGDSVVIDFDGKISEDIGCYRNIRMLRVQFKEGKGPSIIPMA